MQSASQVSPAALTVPLPVPVAFAKVSTFGSRIALALPPKVALTSFAPLILTVQVPSSSDLVSDSQPLQPLSVEPLAAFAVSTTVVPSSSSATAEMQAEAHLIPFGLEETVPTPEPSCVTVSSWVGSASKLAVTSLAELVVTTHSLGVGLLSQPVQPVSSEPTCGASLRTTLAGSFLPPSPPV